MAAEADLALLFSTFDRDKSDTLDFEEWTDLCTALEVPEAEKRTIFNMLDSEHRGFITLKCFIHGFQTVTNLQRFSSQASLASASIETLTEADDRSKPWHSLAPHPNLLRSISDLRRASISETNDDDTLVVAQSSSFKVTDSLECLSPNRWVSIHKKVKFPNIF